MKTFLTVPATAAGCFSIAAATGLPARPRLRLARLPQKGEAWALPPPGGYRCPGHTIGSAHHVALENQTHDARANGGRPRFRDRQGFADRLLLVAAAV